MRFLWPARVQSSRRSMKKNSRILAAVVLSSAGVAALSVHLGQSPRNLESPDPAADSTVAAPEIESVLPITAPETAPPGAEALFTGIGGLEKGAVVKLPLPDGENVAGRINYANTHANAATAAGGLLADGSGIFEIAREPWGYRGFILQQKERIAYVYSSGPDGRLQVARRPIGEVICEPDPNRPPIETAGLPKPEEAAIYNDGRSVGLIYEAIPVLNSLPRAAATIYLDFDGEVIEGHSWEGGARIIAPAYNLSAAEVTGMWQRVAEDFAPYEVNVSTDLQAYLRAPQGQRIRCITTTNQFAAAGGIAFSGTFQQSGEPVCWNFYSGNAGALVISHEVGHTLNLAHDDTTTQGYYGGHGAGATSWGPIMGAPYNQNVCQWSKGDYNNANQQQDDLLIIGAITPRRQDDHASTPTAATPLTLGSGGSVSNAGVIEGPDDIDAFTFTTGGGTLNLQFNGGAGSPNLDIEAKLYNSAGSLVATASPANQLSATLSAGLPAGSYTVTVDGTGNGTWGSNGYDDYGSIGAFTISGTVPAPSWRFQIPVNALNGAVVGTVAPGGSGYSITGGNTGSAFSINASTGVISVTNAGALVSGGLFNLGVSYIGGSTTVPVRVAPARGLKQQIWTGLGGNGIGPLTSLPGYPNSPNVTRYSPTFQTNYGADNYGQKLSGYLLPTETGNHVFWIASDDASELWLSTDANPANKVRVAHATGNTGAGVWDNQGTQQSGNIFLTAGQRYYVEVLHRDQTGPDHVAVAWQTPTLDRRLIANEHLEHPGTLPNRAPWIGNTTFRVVEGSGGGTVVGTLSAGDFEPGSTLSGFIITGGNTNNAFSLNPVTGQLSVNTPLNFANLPKYLLDVSATDSGGLTATAQVAVEVEARAVRRQVWTGVGGNDIANLTALGSYPNNPNSSTYIPFFETPTNSADNYGQRLTGFLRAPDSGDFTFWIASDDDGELWLSTDTNPANKVRIAHVDGSTNPREWGKFGTQKSAPVTLEGGRFYYIEVLHKEGIGGDNLAISWSGPDFGQVMLGAPHVTQSFYNHGAPVLDNRNVTVIDRDDFVVDLEAKDWADPGTTVTYAITGGNADGAFTIDPLTGVIRRSGGTLPAGNRVLTVTASDNGIPVLSDTATITVQVVKAALKREVWTGLTGGQPVSELTGSLYYPGQPSETGHVAEFRAPTGIDDNYGQRLSGYLVPPATGDYTFWIASDDGSELWLSSDANVSNKKKIAQVNGAVGELNWTQQGNQQSAVIPLVAGQAYYIEALQKEGGGGDHLAAAWQGPGFGRTVISGNHLSYPDTYRPVLKREVWPGNATLAPPATPAGITGTMFSFKGPSEVAENFSERITGFLIPPVTGNYSFWLSSDDDGELFLSTDESPANLQSIATVTGYTDPEQWTKFPSQHSAVRTLVAGKRYLIQVHHRDGSFGDHLAVAWDGPGFSREIIANGYLEHPDTPADRSLLRKETWNGIGGDYLPDLTNNAAFPVSPTTVGTLAADAGLVTPTDVADNFGDRVSGYLVAPDHGRYTFWIASDNSSELWLSTDDNPANRIKIASVDNFVAPRNWDAQASQKSAPVALTAGKRYFLEILRKEGIGGDHLAVAWQGPSFARQVIPNAFLEHPLSIPGNPSLKREAWVGIGGSQVGNLTAVSAYQNGTPAARGALTRFEAPAGYGDNYGQRLSARLVAPESGDFKFWIASDHASELWISTDDDPANRMKIAFTTIATGVRAWTQLPSQESGTLQLIAGRRYHIEALHKDSTGADHLAVAWQGPSFPRQVIDGRFLEYPGTPDEAVALKREIWTGVGGNNVTDLTNLGTYPNSPNQTKTLNDFEVPMNESDNYGQKISGYLIAPRTGDYTFWIASDDGGELWLATDGVPASKTRIAFTNNATGFRNWTNNANQTSAVIPLAAGQRCYIEALHKEGGGDDYVSVAWQGPGFDQRIIEARFLEYPGLPAAPTQPGNIVPPTGIDPGYTFWLDFNGLSGSDRLTSADPDKDGLSNSLEFVLGGKPSGANANSASLLPTLALDPVWATFEFRRTDVSQASGPFVQFGTNLTSWNTVVNGVGGAQINTIDDGFGPGVDRVTVKVPVGSGPGFLRLHSNQP